MPPPRRAFMLLAFVTACEQPSPAGPASGGDQAPAETNPAAFDVATSEPGDPLPFLTLNQRALFERGRGMFETEFTPETGLGPLFNTNPCSQCHEGPVTGGTAQAGETHT